MEDGGTVHPFPSQRGEISRNFENGKKIPTFSCFFEEKKNLREEMGVYVALVPRTMYKYYIQ